MSFIKQCDIFHTFILSFFLETSSNNRVTRWIEGQHPWGTWTSNLWPSYQKMREGLWKVPCTRFHIQSSPQWNIIDSQAPSPCWCAQVSLLAFWWWRSFFEKITCFQ
jgi:hypothetical protein